MFYRITGCLLFLVMCFALVGESLAAPIEVQPTKAYILMGSNPTIKSSTLGGITSNVNSASEAAFNSCRTGDRYGCVKMTVTNNTPYGTGRTNGEPAWYVLEREALNVSKRSAESPEESSSGPTGSLGATVSFSCPSGFSPKREGPPEGATMTCIQIERDSDECTGNPINIGTGMKSEYEVDFQTADGALKIERRYVNQNTGWKIDAPDRLVYLASGEEVSSSPSLSGSNLCSNIHVDIRNQYDVDNLENPYSIRSFIHTECPIVMNSGGSPIVHLWSDGMRLRFKRSSGVWRADGALGSKVKLETLDPSQNNNAAWKFIKSNNEANYFSAEGLLLKTEFVQGGWLEYTYVGEKLAIKTDHFGRSLQYIYDADERLISITQPDGNQILYDYGVEKEDVDFLLLQKVTWPDGATMGYLYNEPEHLQGNTSKLSLTGKTDSDGNRIGTYKYSYYRAVSTEGPEGTEKKTVTNHASYVDVTDGINSKRSFFFETKEDGSMLLTRTNQPAGSGCAASFKSAQYYDDGLKKNQADFNGNKTLYEYDHSRGLETVRVEGVGQYDATDYLVEGAVLTGEAIKITTEWHDVWRFPMRIAEANLVTTFVYHGDPDPFDGGQIANCISAVAAKPVLCRSVKQVSSDANGSQGLLVAVDDNAKKQQLLYTYNDYGKIITIKKSPTLSPEITFEYYDYTGPDWTEGDLQSITNTLGHTTLFNSYNKNGFPLSITDPNNVDVQLTYDERDRLIGELVAGSSTTHTYDLNGKRTASVLPNGVDVSYEYDLAKRLIAIQDANGNRVEYEWDAEGNKTKETIKDVNGQLNYTRTNIYDALSRLMQLQSADGNNTDFYYDPNGNSTSIKNARQYTTTNSYDLRNNNSLTTDALGNEIAFTYDSQDNLETVTDQRGNTTQYFYDGFDNLLEIRSPDTGITTFTYDDANNLTTQTDAKGTTTQYFYDALNRLVSVSVVGSPELFTRYYYDDPAYFGVGRLTRIEDSVSTTAYRYDHLGNIVTTIVNYIVDGQGPTNDIVTQYVYDLAGNLVETTLPSGRVVSQYRDNLGRVADVSTASAANGGSIVTGVNYLPFGPATGWTFGNGIQQVNSYDLDYRITSMALNASNDPASNYQLDFIYDPVSNITDITESGSGSFSYTYDELDRLTNADTPTAVYEYRYDEVGNRLFSSILTATGIEFQDYVYESQNNRLYRIDNGSEVRLFTYDDNGNIIADDRGDQPGIIFNYSQENRLESVETGVNP